jgi:predicted metal-dependent hydrolase
MSAAGQLPRDDEGVPLYTVRVSGRARRVRLEVSPCDGVVLVLPKRMSLASAREFVREKQAWIEAAWSKIGMHLAALRPDPEVSVPETVELRALEETWRVDCCGLRNGCAGWEADAGTRTLRIFADGADSARRVLRRWLLGHAKAALPPWLERVAAECGLPAGKPGHRNPRAAAVTVRLLSSRWGSCSADGRICLNAKLLFLPAAQVRYVMVHELCHTLHLDHSARFWDEVERLEPYAFAIRGKLRHASRYMPHWVEDAEG